MELRKFEDSRNVIEEITEGSIAEELSIEAGDILLRVNETIVRDIIDYKYLISDEYILLEIEKPNGDIWELEIEKEIDEDLGLIFTNPLIDKAKHCRNKCIFCFIDQLPENMRETLYFKDDDSRLSFLQGNFITLTNMSDSEIDRIIKYRLSPINVSVHTTNPKLRIEMLNNKNAGKILDILKRFYEAKLEVNCQIVLVPGINDGIELKKTLDDLSTLYPTIKSVAIVPIGVTRFRSGLKKVDIFNEMLSKDLIRNIKGVQKKYLEEKETRFVFLSDEFYALAKEKLPLYEEYENFPQLENGVGLMKLFEYEVILGLNKIKKEDLNNRTYIIATGTLAHEFMKNLSNEIEKRFKGLQIIVKPIINNYFGDTITVSGLITGVDMINQLKGLQNDGIIIPRSMLKSGEDIFLDNLTIAEVSKQLSSKIIVSEVSGGDFLEIFKTGV